MCEGGSSIRLKEEKSRVKQGHVFRDDKTFSIVWNYKYPTHEGHCLPMKSNKMFLRHRLVQHWEGARRRGVERGAILQIRLERGAPKAEKGLERGAILESD